VAFHPEAQLMQLVAEVASAYFSNTQVGPHEIPRVIADITASLRAVPHTKEDPQDASSRSDAR